MPPSTRVPNFFTQVVEIAQEQRVNPFMGRINLGGGAGAGGGVGGPPGGFLGKLIQSKVAYDTTEGSTLSTGSSASLVDNLNHIRARLAILEAATAGAGGVITGGAEYVQSEYAGGNIDLGLSNDGGWVDVTNGSIAITPTAAGVYQVTFSFSQYWQFTNDSDYRGSIAFRLTDGVSALNPVKNGLDAGFGPGAIVQFSVSGLFVWPDGTARTVKLQKQNTNASAVLAINRILAQDGFALHMDVFRLGGGVAVITDEAYERIWWGW